MEVVSLESAADVTDPLQNPLRYLGSHVRILAALIDAIVLPWEWEEWRIIGHVETAISREQPLLNRQGWNHDKAKRLMRERGWADLHAIYNESGMSEKQRQAHALYLEGKTTREIGGALNAPPVTVRVWLFRAAERLRALDQGEFGETLGGN